MKINTGSGRPELGRRPAKYLGHGLWKQGDGGVIDGIGPDGVAAAAVAIARRVVTHYN